MAKVQITQLRSAAGSNKAQRETLRSLGLGRIGQTTERDSSPQLTGMIRAVDHLVEVSGDKGDK